MATNFILAMFAVIGLAQLITKEAGAFGIFERIRTRFPLGGLLDCPYCLMVWLAIPAAYWVSLENNIGVPMVYVVWLALIGAAYCVRRYSGLDYR